MGHKKHKKGKKNKKGKNGGKALDYFSGTEYNGGYTTKTCCHKGESAVLKIYGCDIFGASSFYGDEDGKEFDLVLNCANTGLSAMVVPPKMRHLLKYYQPTNRVIKMPWKDFGGPPVSFDFWPALVQELNGVKDMLVFCIGGHGRTGTALAAMWIAAGKKISAVEAIDVVRKHYCKDAIEATEQVDYLVRMAEHFGGPTYEGRLFDLLPELKKPAPTRPIVTTNAGTGTLCSDCYKAAYDWRRCPQHETMDDYTKDLAKDLPEGSRNKIERETIECRTCFLPPEYDICQFHQIANDCGACLKLPVAVYCGEHTKPEGENVTESK